MRVTVEDIKKIKAGKSKTFIVESPDAVNCAKSLASYVKKYRKMPHGVAGYTCTTNVDVNAITITAIGL